MRPTVPGISESSNHSTCFWCSHQVSVYRLKTTQMSFVCTMEGTPQGRCWECFTEDTHPLRMDSILHQINCLLSSSRTTINLSLVSRLPIKPWRVLVRNVSVQLRVITCNSVYCCPLSQKWYFERFHRILITICYASFFNLPGQWWRKLVRIVVEKKISLNKIVPSLQHQPGRRWYI